MSQRQQLERILEIDRRIRAGLFPTADGLARDLEVSRRVIFKDRTFLMDRLGAPLVFDRSRGGWAYSDPTYALPSVMVTEGEMLALVLSVELAGRYLGTTFEGPLRSAVAKIARGLKGPVSVDLGDLGAGTSVSAPAALQAREPVLLDLHDALRKQMKARMVYFTAGRRERTERVVNPYHLHHMGGEWYLVAYDHLRRRFRTFHVGRIESLEVLEETFIRDRNFSVEEYLGRSFHAVDGPDVHEVAIAFDASQAPYIRERTFHPTQRIEERPDGGLVLSFSTSGLGAVLQWVLQYGSHAEVLSPEALREDAALEIKALARLYGLKKGGKKKSKKKK